MQKGPKIGGWPLRDDQSAVTGARRESSNRRHDGTHRRANPIVLIPPIPRQGVNTAAAGGGKFRVEPWNLGVVMRRKPINCVRAPFGVNISKYRRIDGPVIFVNKSAEKICPFIKLSWDPLRFQNDVVNKTEIKNVHSQSLEISFGASDSNYSGSALIVSKDFNSLVFQLSNVGKQHEINSFQLAERRTTADILGFPHAANNGAVQRSGETSESYITCIGKHNGMCRQWWPYRITVEAIDVAEPKFELD